MKTSMIAFAMAFLAGAASSPALAVERSSQTAVVFSPTADFGIDVGGGVNTFATELDRQTRPGVAWEVRGVYGQRQLLGLEAAYVGTANDLKETDGETARLMSHGGEALLRASVGMKNLGLHVLRGGDVISYIAAGGGFGVMSATDDTGARIDRVAGVRYQDSSTFHIPAAIGVDAIVGDHFVFGVRGNYKYEIGNDVRADVAKADVQSWQAVGRLGLAF